MEIIYTDLRVKEFGFKPETSHSAGYDLRACIDKPLHIHPGNTEKIDTGIRIHMGELDEGVVPCAIIFPRSGLGCRGIRPRNAPGLIDADYQGNIVVCLYNGSTNELIIQPMDRIAQLVFTIALHPQAIEVESFSEGTIRGNGGFGSTGVS